MAKEQANMHELEYECRWFLIHATVLLIIMQQGGGRDPNM